MPSGRPSTCRSRRPYPRSPRSTEANAIDFTQQDEIQGIEVGAAILAPGFEQFDPNLKKELGYGRYPNVVSSLQFERILSASGPYLGSVLR
ncbi:MAG: hypothetical protein ACYTA3_01895, partial [Planctomycetota bacterium]